MMNWSRICHEKEDSIKYGMAFRWSLELHDSIQLLQTLEQISSDSENIFSNNILSDALYGDDFF